MNTKNRSSFYGVFTAAIFASLVIGGALGTARPTFAQTNGTPVILRLDQAPTNPPPSTPVGFFNAVIPYFTSHNPENAGIFNQAGESWVSADYQNNLNVSYSLGLDYNFVRKTNYNFALESVSRFADTAGTIVSEQAGIKWQRIIGGDTAIGLFLEGGYTLNHADAALVDNMFGEVGLEIQKALTRNTYGGLRIGEDFYFKKHDVARPVISVKWGVSW